MRNAINKVASTVASQEGSGSLMPPFYEALEDWPQSGKIDLSVQDAPHKSSSLEWWYLHAHLNGQDGRNLAVFCSFFRVAMGNDEKTKEPKYAHILAWSLTDVENARYFTESSLEEVFLDVGLERLRNGDAFKDPRLRRALEEMLVKKQMPKPDRVVTSPVRCLTTALELDFDGSSLRKTPEGNYLVRLVGDKASCELEFRPKKAAVIHGADGVVAGPQGERMFYYFIPRNEVYGRATIEGEDMRVTGDGWYDHQFGRRIDEGMPHKVGWNWCALQLDDCSEVTVSVTKDPTKTRDLAATVVHVDAHGNVKRSSNVHFNPTQWWRSVRTFEQYPVAWVVKAPDLGLDISLAATVEDQEFVTLISKPAFWEGQHHASGTLHGKRVNGRAYVERTGFAGADALDTLLKGVSCEVRELMESFLPLEPDAKRSLSLFAQEERPRMLSDVEISQLSQNLIRPLREVTDRGGKGWRSYALLLCCDAVGGDSRKFRHWLALPEIMHAASLIIDDVEDKSEVRRGGPTIHRVYGEATAINAGTFAYFLGGQFIQSSKDVSDADKLRLYDLYFEGMREAHAGQALDLSGFEKLAEATARTGDAAELERRIMGAYRLKSAAPVACLARCGAILGGASEAQTEALGAYFESLGVAFQLVDDVLNLRGFEGNLKKTGEDITAGKTTFVLANSLARLDANERGKLLSLLQLKTTDSEKILEATRMMEGTGAVDACVKMAYDMVESSWTQLEPFLEPSIAKLILRAFGQYVIERHY